MTDPNRAALVETLADAEHASWARWMTWLFAACPTDKDTGNVVIPAALADRWKRQAATRYADLTESEKESDRAEVAKIMPAIDVYAAGRAELARANQALRLAVLDLRAALEPFALNYPAVANLDYARLTPADRVAMAASVGAHRRAAHAFRATSTSLATTEPDELGSRRTPH